MTATATKSDLTSADLRRLTEEAGVEYVDGELLEKTVSELSTTTASRITIGMGRCAGYAKAFQIADGTLGYRVYPDAMKFRKPDISVIRTSRGQGKPDKGFRTIPADLVVEVISPRDDGYEIEAKIREYLDHGFGIVWIVYPGTKTVYAHTLKDVRRFGVSDEIDGGELLPELRCSVSDFFA